MTWPSGAVVTTNVDATTDDPELAVVQIKDAFDKLNQIIAHVTAFAQTVLDDADAATVRSTLGLAALAIKATIATADIDNDAVTYAKIQNVSATNKMLGRATAGAGDIEEIDVTAAARSILDDTTVAAILVTLGGAPLASPSFTGPMTFAGSTVGQNSKSTAYTTVAADANKHILHPTADNNPRTFTIDSNANVPYDIGTAITFVNKINTVTIAITADTLTMAGTGTTGSRTLAANGIATALKVSATEWLISGTGLS